MARNGLRLALLAAFVAGCGGQVSDETAGASLPAGSARSSASPAPPGAPPAHASWDVAEVCDQAQLTSARNTASSAAELESLVSGAFAACERGDAMAELVDTSLAPDEDFGFVAKDGVVYALRAAPGAFLPKNCAHCSIGEVRFESEKKLSFVRSKGPRVFRASFTPARDVLFLDNGARTLVFVRAATL